MKLVTAIVKPYELENGEDAMKAVGVTGMTVDEVKGFGRQGGKAEIHRGSEYVVDLLPKVNVEAVVEDDQVALVVETIGRNARSGNVGGGKVWVSPIDQIVRIRTAELGTGAI